MPRRAAGNCWATRLTIAGKNKLFFFVASANIVNLLFAQATMQIRRKYRAFDSAVRSTARFKGA